MDEAEKFSVDDKSNISSEREHHRHHGEHHHGEHHHSGRSHHHSERKSRGHDSQRKVVRDRMREVKWEKFYKPVLRVIFFVAFIVLLVMIVWAIFHPNEQVSEVSQRDYEVTDKVQAGIQIEELHAEIESLKEQLDEYEEKIAELEERLAVAKIEKAEDGPSESNGGENRTENEE